MTVNLAKGQKVSLTKDSPEIKRLVVCMGWDVNAYDTREIFDLDASAFMLGANGKVADSRDFVFYGNLAHSSGAVVHRSDIPTNSGDDAQIIVDLQLMPEYVLRIAFSATIYDAEERRQGFGQVSNAYIRIIDEQTGTELMRYDVAERFSHETAVVFGEIYKNNNEWKFNAIGNGYLGNLAALCDRYGVEVG